MDATALRTAYIAAYIAAVHGSDAGSRYTAGVRLNALHPQVVAAGLNPIALEAEARKVHAARFERYAR